MPEPLNPEQISVAVIIGGHAYDVPAFKRLFDSFEDVVAYPQDISNFSRAWGVPPDAYDVLLFYNAGGDTAADLDATWGAGTSAAVEAVGQAEQGVVMLHHAIRSYMAWPKWSALLGIPTSSGKDRSSPSNSGRPCASASPTPATRSAVGSSPGTSSTRRGRPWRGRPRRTRRSS